ncbi:hypothetical protein [Micromonospora zamorensis]|uniref:hypothetical protein n=1 Tax=Micromonospora zamorensis TaxID=709883 RepID=UPI0037B56C04
MENPTANNAVTAEQLAAQLAEERALLETQRRDEQERRRLEAEHRLALADLAETTTSSKRARKERDRDEVEAAKLAELYRWANRSGTRARIRADINRSAEVRALRVERVGKASLWAGVPVLVAFGLWSTSGVQAGVVKLLDLEGGSFGWWAAWLMEPALLTIVALIIVGRSLLLASGGNTDWRALAIEWAALGTSLALNVTPTLAGVDKWEFPAVVGELGGPLIAESVGPIGAAGTAFLIGLFHSYVAKAKPWEGAPRLAELDLGLAISQTVQAADLPAGEVPAEVAVTPQAADEAVVSEPVTPTEGDADAVTQDVTHGGDASGDASGDAPTSDASGGADAPVTHDVTQDGDASGAGDAPSEADAPVTQELTPDADAPAGDAPLTRDERLTLAVMEVLEGTVPSARAAALKHAVDTQAVQRRVRTQRAQSQTEGQGPLARAGVTDTQ